jgi:hypothetical protein
MPEANMRMTSKQSIAALALVILAGSASASPIYLCVDAQGRKELTDTNKRGCKPLDLPDNIPAPARAQDPAAARPRAQAAAPADFPRVDSSVQRARDDDRRGILNEELRLEAQKLSDLKAEYKNGEPERLGSERNYAKYQERVANLRDAISRSERNIEALRREISNIR